MNSSDITRARRLQVANNALIFPNKPHNLSGIQQLCVRRVIGGKLPRKSLPPDLKSLLRPRDGGVRKVNNTPANNPNCCGRI
jgi:hypothetical protein